MGLHRARVSGTCGRAHSTVLGVGLVFYVSGLWISVMAEYAPTQVTIDPKRGIERCRFNIVRWNLRDQYSIQMDIIHQNNIKWKVYVIFLGIALGFHP